MAFLNALFISLFITVVLVPFFRRLAYKINAVDKPDERKVHVRPMARTGGLAMAVGALLPLFLWGQAEVLRPWLLACAIIVAAGFVDDLVGLGHRAKFGAQILAAAVVVLYGGIAVTNLGALLPEGRLLPAWLSIPLSIVVIVGVTNAINLADGLDGLAGGITVISFLLLGYLGLRAGDAVVVMVAAAVIGAIFGFLRYNTYPATIFMGDAGSQLLGFLAITVSLYLIRTDVIYSPLLPLLLLGFPILDTLTVMLARIYNGRSPFAADKNHFHHKLMRLGLAHREAVLAIYLVQLGLVLAAYRLRFSSDWLILGWALGIGSAVSLFFYLSSRFGWRLPRKAENLPGNFQKILAEAHLLTRVLKVLFLLLRINFSLVLLVAVLPMAGIPGWFAGLALALAGVVLVLMFAGSRHYEFFLRAAVYLPLPLLVYWGAVAAADGRVSWCPCCSAGWFYGPLYVSLIIFSLLLLKLTRRDGYQSTPLDFLILMTAILLPSVAPAELAGGQVKTLAIRIIAVFFALEVILEESRTRNLDLGLTVVGVLLLVGLRWLTGVV
ncbi:MAG: undecaprenyl/decaprenyl-phosphate alpha-N-acetylglucosaminyl 1-phosphate transferase [Deltaproteobacteria bacterium]|nr:undecaprenyl/decaprenyl-phosphate alpha-N-acetylglucosaminyl 1-phosphate transferase [Deltaproteobacteria bacterium]